MTFAELLDRHGGEIEDLDEEVLALLEASALGKDSVESIADAPQDQLADRVWSLEGSVAICIDVDDPEWTWLVDALMPSHDWQQYRDLGQVPVARGIVPRGLVVETVERCYPAALPAPDGPFVAVFAAGGITLFSERFVLGE